MSKKKKKKPRKKAAPKKKKQKNKKKNDYCLKKSIKNELMNKILIIRKKYGPACSQK